MTESASSFTQFSTYTGVLFTIALVIIGGGSMEMVWALVNTLQLIAYFPLMTPYFPQHVRTMFEILKFANGDFEFLSGMFDSIVSVSRIQPREFSYVFTRNDIETSNFLENASSLMMSLLLSLILFVTALTLSMFC